MKKLSAALAMLTVMVSTAMAGNIGPCVNEHPRITGIACVGSGDRCYCADLENQCGHKVMVWYDRYIRSSGKAWENKKIYLDPYERDTELCTTTDGTEFFHFKAERYP